MLPGPCVATPYPNYDPFAGDEEAAKEAYRLSIMAVVPNVASWEDCCRLGQSYTGCSASVYRVGDLCEHHRTVPTFRDITYTPPDQYVGSWVTTLLHEGHVLV